MQQNLLACALVAFTVPAVAAATETEHITKTAALAPGGTLRLKNFSGSVTITGTDRADASIDAVRRASQERLDHIKLDVHTEGSTLVVNANVDDGSGFWWSRNNRVVETDLDIKVPRRTNLNLDVFSSPITVDSVDGSHKVHTFSARVRLDNVNGPITAHSFSGGIEITQNTWQPNQSIDIDTFSGDVQLHLPESARGAVTFNSFSGHLNSDIPLTLRNGSRRAMRADLGGTSDGGTLRFKTFSGSVRINR